MDLCQLELTYAICNYDKPRAFAKTPGLSVRTNMGFLFTLRLSVWVVLRSYIGIQFSHILCILPRLPSLGFAFVCLFDSLRCLRKFGRYQRSSWLRSLPSFVMCHMYAFEDRTVFTNIECSMGVQYSKYALAK